MYSQKQLENWGREVPSTFLKCSKSAAVLTSIFAALNFQIKTMVPKSITILSLIFGMLIVQAIEAKPVKIERNVIKN